jgi:ATP-binding cassette subfamily B (MDR/TAP) protein 1
VVRARAVSSAIRKRDPAYLTEWKPFLGLLALLLRFYEPCKGQVTFGGRDSRSIPLKELRSRCAYVSQDPQLFEGTIRWNLCRESTSPPVLPQAKCVVACWLLTHLLFSYAVGAVNAGQVTQEALEEACDQACILDFIRGLKDGFETEIGMKGAALSGGQRQVRDP